MTWKRLILLVGAVALLVRLPWRRLFDALAAARQSAQSWASAGSPHLSEDPSAVQSTVRPLVERPTPTRTDPEDAFVAAPGADEVAATGMGAAVEPELLAPDGLELLPNAIDTAPGSTVEPELLAPDGLELQPPGEPPLSGQQLIPPAPSASPSLKVDIKKESEPSANPAAATSPSGEARGGVGDDLLRIEGIGPRVSTVVSAAGYSSFADLAAAEVAELRALLSDAGYETLDPSTWPAQARLAADGRWEELRELQGRIVNGKLT